jgi:hypothetical protein
MKIAHIINPVNVTETSDLFIAQPVTFETMRRAKKYASDNKLEVELFYTCYEEDLPVAPAGFIQTKLLEKSILDHQDFEKKRKLPLIKDILDRLYESSDADYFIYTNVDIAVQENFYIEVKNIINQGYDAFVINRRTIDKKYTSIEEIPEMYQDRGEKHPGYDCFVFKRDVYPSYKLGIACIGANWIGRVLISNVIAYSNKFKVFEDEYLTFHIGDDRSWKISDFNNYDKNNEDIVIDILKKLNNQYLINHDLLKLFIKQHKIDININPCISFEHKFTHDLKNPLNEVYFDNYKPSSEWSDSFILNQNPIFIIGYPRSGTTLFQSLLSTQDNLVSLPETHFFNWVRNNLKVKKDKIINKDVQKLIIIIRQRIPLSTNAEKQILKLIEEQLLSPKMLFEIIVIDNLLKNIDSIGELKQKNWIEKTPDHVLYLDVILRWYPNAKFIYLVRNPEQAIISRRKNFINETNWKIEQHINAWKKSVEAFEKFQKNYPSKIKIIKLEDLTNNTNSTMIEICDFLKINFQEDKLSNYKNIAKQVSLTSESWKKDVENKEISISISKNDKKLNLSDRIKLVEDLKYFLKRYGYFEQEYKELDLDLENLKSNSIEHTNSTIEEAFEILCSISVIKNPIKKYRAYKNLLKVYNETK